MQGFNIRTKIGTKTLLGYTQDDFKVSAVTKESITKDDAGITNKVVTRHDITISMSAIYMLDSATSSTTKLDRDDVIALALLTGDEAKVAIEYGPTGGDIYQGNAIITGYSESSGASADDDATISLDLEVIGNLTKKSA